MKGLDLSRAYFQEVVRPILAANVPELGDDYAAALLGWGSDVLGYDDRLSRDHEWGPRCYLFLPSHLQEHADKVREELNRHTPSEFRGFPTRFVFDPDRPTVRVPSEGREGRVHVEITTCERYLKSTIGTIAPANDLEWLAIPETQLLELTRGEVFFDGTGELTRIRSYYDYFPVDVWKYRLAYAWQALSWDIDIVQLCTVRGDTLSARDTLARSLSGIMELAFLLNKRYRPYLKWLHREFYELPYLSGEIGPIVERCYAASDLTLVPDLLGAACSLLLDHQDQLGELPRIEVRPHKTARPYPDVDFQNVAEQIHGAVQGQLRTVSLVGALDKWVGNPDLLLDADKLEPLSSVYHAPLRLDKLGSLDRFA